MLSVGGTPGDITIFHLTLLRLFHRLLDKFCIAVLPQSLPEQVTLNDHLLQLVDNACLIELEPVEQEPSRTVSLSALSFGFQVFEEANIKACMYLCIHDIGKEHI